MSANRGRQPAADLPRRCEPRQTHPLRDQGRAGRCRRTPPPRPARLRASNPADRSRTVATSDTWSRPKRRCAQRERTVGRSVSGREVTSTNTDAGSGSSSVLSSAFSAADHERVGLLDDGHALAAFEGPKDRLLDRRPHLLDLDRPAFARLDHHHVGMRSHGRCGDTPRTRRTRRSSSIFRQLSSCAIDTAIRRLPTPSGRTR